MPYPLACLCKSLSEEEGERGGKGDVARGFSSWGGVGGRAINPCGFWLSGLAGFTDPGTFPLRFQNEGPPLESVEFVEEVEGEDLRELIRGDSEASVERRAKAWVTGVKALESCSPMVAGDEVARALVSSDATRC